MKRIQELEDFRSTVFAVGRELNTHPMFLDLAVKYPAQMTWLFNSYDRLEIGLAKLRKARLLNKLRKEIDDSAKKMGKWHRGVLCAQSQPSAYRWHGDPWERIEQALSRGLPKLLGPYLALGVEFGRIIAEAYLSRSIPNEFTEPFSLEKLSKVIKAAKAIPRSSLGVSPVLKYLHSARNLAPHSKPYDRRSYERVENSNRSLSHNFGTDMPLPDYWKEVTGWITPTSSPTWAIEPEGGKRVR